MEEGPRVDWGLMRIWWSYGPPKTVFVIFFNFNFFVVRAFRAPESQRESNPHSDSRAQVDRTVQLLLRKISMNKIRFTYTSTSKNIHSYKNIIGALRNAPYDANNSQFHHPRCTTPTTKNINEKNRFPYTSTTKNINSPRTMHVGWIYVFSDSYRTSSTTKRSSKIDRTVLSW